MFLATLLGLLGSAASARAQVDLVHQRAPNYVAVHNAMVMHAFLRFATLQAPEQQQDRLVVLRERDRLQLFGVVTPSDAQAGWGVALFGTMTILAAHSPVRALFDGPVHLGPAVFENGGLGAGIGGRFYL